MLFAGFAALVGVGFGYFLRWIISLGQRGSVELRIKQMELHAREEAKKIAEEATTKAEETAKEKGKNSKKERKKFKRQKIASLKRGVFG